MNKYIKGFGLSLVASMLLVGCDGGTGTVNIAPVAVDDQVIADEDTQYTSVASLLVNDIDMNGDVLTALSGAFETAQGGELVLLEDGTYTYTPAANFSGVDTVDYTVTDGLLSDTGTLSITVTLVNMAPVAVDDTIRATEGVEYAGTVSLLANDTDSDNNPLTAVDDVFTTAAGGELVLAADGTYTYMPAANYNGADSVDYTVSDGDLTDVGTLTIDVVSVNDAPIAVDDNVLATEDTPFNGDLVANDTDVDGDTLTVVTSGTETTDQGGSLVLAVDGTYSYTPVADFNGVDTFTYTVTDGIVEDTGLLTIDVAPVNDAPVAVDDAEVAILNTALTGAPSLIANDTDVDGDALTALEGTFPTTAGGELVLAADGSYTYTPLGGFVGDDTATYTVLDSSGITDIGTLTIHVAP